MRTTEAEVRAYYDGVLEGIYRYAYMRDGVFYVGTTGRTFQEAIAEVKQEKQTALANLVGAGNEKS